MALASISTMGRAGTITAITATIGGIGATDIPSFRLYS
jgi:hypothetical protein